MTAGDVRALGCYVLPGGVRDPKRGLAEARTAEASGLGAVWIGERYDTKDLPSLAGAIGTVTSRVAIGAAVTSPGLRHPMVLASMGQTLQALTDGRFRLGFGRSAAWRWRAYGVAPPTLASLGATADVLRRLWAGETVRHDGPAGRLPELRLPQRPDVDPPPLLLAAVGPATLALAGRSFDGVILHPFLTPDAVRRSVAAVRAAASEAGRDPSRVLCCAAVVVAAGLDEHAAGLAVGARAAGYLHVAGLGDALAAANRWDPGELARYRAHPVLAALGSAQADKALDRDQLVELSATLPPTWIPSSSAVGDPAVVAARLAAYREAGADELVLHGSTADQLGPLVDAVVARPSR